MNYSTTQMANLAVLAGFVVFILKYFNIALSQEEITTVLGLIIGLGGLLVSWYKRYKKGDLTIAGFRVRD